MLSYIHNPKALESELVLVYKVHMVNNGGNPNQV